MSEYYIRREVRMLYDKILSAPERQPSLKTVLVVEDDTSVAKSLALAISTETPHGVLLVSNGREALATLKEITPDLILVDYQLPEMNGLAFYDLLRSMKGQEGTPVVFLSESTPLDVVKEVGYREVTLIEKPFELSDLLNVLHYALVAS